MHTQLTHSLFLLKMYLTQVIQEATYQNSDLFILHDSKFDLQLHLLN